MPTNLNDPLQSPDDPYRTTRADDRYRRAAELDNELQPDPELAEGRASSGRIALFAVAIALVLGAVFYGLNNSTINHAGTSTTSTAQTTQPSPPAPAPKANNNGQGVTTGAAPAPTQNPPANPAPGK
jgi:cell division septation protein DedD